MSYDDLMSVLHWPDHLLSMEEWDALPEDNSRHFELVEGVLHVSPRPRPQHQVAAANLAVVLNGQLPPTLVAIPDTEVVIDAAHPPTVRAPDVVITSAARYKENLPRFDAGDVLLAIEVISPGSLSLDRYVKPVEYAMAGIPHYWVISLDEPATLTAFTLVGGGYEIAVHGAEHVQLVEPVSIAIEVGELTRPDYPWLD
jgi:Uma2 family endonuclease